MLLLLTSFSSYALANVADYLEKSSGMSRSIVDNKLAKINHYCRWLEGDWQRYYHVLPRIINERGLKIGCEIGVSVGGHSEAILKSTNIQKLYSVDPYKINKAGFSEEDDIFHDLLFLWVEYRLNKYAPRSQMVRLFSVEASALFENESLDFVFIDGDHSYEAVRDDINAWYSKVRIGGIVSGDDYTTWPGVKKAVDEIFGKKGLTVYHDDREPRVWWVERV
jgi:hypothetical protein